MKLDTAVAEVIWERFGDGTWEIHYSERTDARNVWILRDSAHVRLPNGQRITAGRKRSAKFSREELDNGGVTVGDSIYFSCLGRARYENY